MADPKYASLPGIVGFVCAYGPCIFLLNVNLRVLFYNVKIISKFSRQTELYSPSSVEKNVGGVFVDRR